MQPAFITIGVIPPISTTKGAKTVTLLDITLQKPNTLAAKRVGISYMLAM